MGSYVNPSNETKETFLQREGRVASHEERWAVEQGMIDEAFLSKGFLPVVLANNGLFTAAGILYSKKEALAWSDPSDNRPKTIYIVPLEKLWAASNLANYLDPPKPK